MIQLIITACLLGQSNFCSELTVDTQYTSVQECQTYSMMLLPSIMAEHPKRRLARFKCVERRTGEDI